MISNIQLHTCSSLHRYQPKSLTHQIVNSTAGEAGTQAAQASLARDGVVHLDLATGEDGANPLGEAGTQASPERAARKEDGVVLHLGVLHLGVLAHLGASQARVARTEDGVDGVVLHLGVLNHLGDLGVALRAASPNPQKDVTPHGAAHHLGAHQLGAHQDGAQASQARDLIGLETHQDGAQASQARVHLATGQIHGVVHLHPTGKIHGHQLLLGMLLLGVVIVESLARAHPIGLDGVPSKKLKM